MRRILLLAALVLFATAVEAQVGGIYVTSANMRLSNVPSGGAGSQTYDSFWTSGIGGGVTMNFLPLPVVSLGIDLRGSTRPGTTGADTALAGIKLGIHPPALNLKPYLQGSAGYLAVRTPSVVTGATMNNKYLAWEILGGVDYSLVRFIDIRVVEIGGGSVIGSGNGNTPSLFTINTGLVFHF